MSNRPTPDHPAPGEHDRTVVTKLAEANRENDATIKTPASTGEFAATIKGAAAGGAGPSPSKSELSAGSRFGRYEVKRLLGRGAMGAVYLARDVQLDREVAIKIPTFGPQDGPEDVERFYREARAMATLSHPNLCPVYDVGEIDGVHYLTMQFVEGRPMEDFLKGGKSHPAKQVAAVVRKLAVALEEAHQAGVVHRDLKPANIMLDKRQEPIIMDFGLAQRRKENETTLTQAGQIMGTPSYMSPEQVRGKHKIIGPPSDVYALGVICYQLLTGKLPFTGSLGEVMAAILSQEPEPPSKLNPTVDRSIEAICLQAMAKDIGQRYASAALLATSLRGYLRGERLHEEDTALAVSEADSTESTDSVNTTGKEMALAGNLFADLVVEEQQVPVVTTKPALRGKRRGRSRSKQTPNWLWVAGGSGAFLLLIIIVLIGSKTGSDERKVAGKPGGSINAADAAITSNTVKKSSTSTMEPFKPSRQFDVTLPTQPGPSNANSDSVVGFPEGAFYMTTKSAEGQGLVLESSPLTLRKCSDSAGMRWKAVPHPPGQGYFVLTSEALVKQNLVLEGADGKAAALMLPRWASGTWWKAVPAGDGYYYLISAISERAGIVLDGNVGEAQGTGARVQGSPILVDKNSAGPTALWKFLPVATTGS